MSTMTKTQVAKAMKAASIEGELTGRGTSWEVELKDEETMESFVSKVCPVGGYKTGYGAWVLRPGYKVDDVDFNHVASRSHY